MPILRALLLLALTLPALAPRAWADEPAPAPAPGQPAPAEEHGEGSSPGDPDAHAPADAKAYAAGLREVLSSLRADALQQTEARIEAAQSRQLDRISEILAYVSLGGFLLLLAPLWLRRRFPGQMGTLVKYSVLASFTFVLAIFLFSVALMVLREAQNAFGAQTNPKLAIVEGMFHALDDSAEDLAPLGPDLIEPTLQQVAAGSEQPVQILLLENLQKLHQSATVFTQVASLMRGVTGIMGLLPVVLSFLAVALFLRNFLPLMRDIVTLPARAAGGEAGAGRRLLGQTFRQVGRELLVIVGFIGALLVVTLLSGFILAHVVAPAMSAVLWFLITAFLYLQVQPDAATGWLLVSLVGVVVYLVLNLAIVTLASIFTLSKLQKILRAKFHHQVPLATHGGFWRWGTLSFLWTEALPLLFIVGVGPGVVALFEGFLAGEHPSLLSALLVSGAILALGLPLVFWALRGVKALVFLIRTRITSTVGAPEPAPGA